MQIQVFLFDDNEAQIGQKNDWKVTKNVHFFYLRVRLLERTSSAATGGPRLVRGVLVVPEVLLVPFTTGADRFGEAEAAAAARAPARREVAVLAGGVLSSVSNMVAGEGGMLYCVGVIPRRSSIMRNWVSASLHSRCFTFISSVCPCCSCSCKRKIKHSVPCHRKYSQLQYSKAVVYLSVLHATFPSCAARMSYWLGWSL